MEDALNALRPQRLRTKAASSLLPHWLDGYSECNSCSSRVLLAHVESANCPVAYQGLKITTSLSSVSMIFSVCVYHRSQNIQKKKAERMKQMDLIDWLDGKRVIRQLPPTQSTQHRLFIIKELKPIMRELEALELSLSAPDGMIVSRRRREICQSEVRDSARGRLKFYPE
ncbi:hypothetical protein BPLS_P2317 [Bathymodiolus platifrons methanotrophic gill symbiont]|nr:hypothetical protein BPLS_P2317 [Bathymodiolus platifrons methanotrophic gill symbiont]